MGYRITNNMMTNTYLSNLHGNLGRLTDVQRQMLSGKLYDRPSQNPIDVVRDLSLTTNIFENVQYIRNMDDAITWLKNTDQGLGQITDGIQRIRELAIYAGDGALESTEVEAIALEIEQLRDELMMTANYSVEGRYLLAGLATGTVPFVKDAEGNIVYQGNRGNVQFEMQQAFVGQVSLNGRDVFPEQFTPEQPPERGGAHRFRMEGTQRNHPDSGGRTKLPRCVSPSSGPTITPTAFGMPRIRISSGTAVNWMDTTLIRSPPSSATAPTWGI